MLEQGFSRRLWQPLSILCSVTGMESRGTVTGWFGHNYLSEDIHVGYNDTILELGAGTAGSLIAGGLMTVWASRLAKPAGRASSSRTG